MMRAGLPFCPPPLRRPLPRPPTRPRTLHQRGRCWPTGAGEAPLLPLPDVRVVVGSEELQGPRRQEQASA